MRGAIVTSARMIARRAAFILALLAGSTSGCMGLYAEANATVYPSIKYREVDNSSAPTPKPITEDGGGFALGFSVGFDFDGRRANRVAVGYTAHSTTLPGGGSVSGGQSELRADFKLATTSKTSRFRLGMGFGFGKATTTLKTADGAELSDRRGNGQAFIGPVFAQYFGKHHELSLMGAVSYFGAGVPGGGSIQGTGVGARLTYSFHFGDTRPSSTTYTPLENGQNILDVVDKGAKRIGCDSKYIERRSETYGGGFGLTATAVLARCPPDDEEIIFLQTLDGITVECSHLDDDECKQLTGRIIDAAKGVLHDKTAPAAPAPPAPTAPLPAPVPMTPPVPGATGASVPAAAQPAPAS